MQCRGVVTQGVQIPNHHILTQNLYHNSYYPKPTYLIIGYLDPLGKLGFRAQGVGLSGGLHLGFGVYDLGLRV